MPERMAVLLEMLGEPVPSSSALVQGKRTGSLEGTARDTWADLRIRRPYARLILRGEKVVPLFMIPAEEP